MAILKKCFIHCQMKKGTQKNALLLKGSLFRDPGPFWHFGSLIWFLFFSGSPFSMFLNVWCISIFSPVYALIFLICHFGSQFFPLGSLLGPYFIKIWPPIGSLFLCSQIPKSFKNSENGIMWEKFLAGGGGGGILNTTSWYIFTNLFFLHAKIISRCLSIFLKIKKHFPKTLLPEGS